LPVNNLETAQRLCLVL